MPLLKIPAGEGQKTSAFGGGSFPSRKPTPAPLQRRGIIFMLNGAAPGGMGNSSENPPIKGERRSVLRLSSAMFTIGHPPAIIFILRCTRTPTRRILSENLLQSLLDANL